MTCERTVAASRLMMAVVLLDCSLGKPRCRLFDGFRLLCP